ncbi:phosphate:H+ symporter [Raoultella planticola]|uniref:Phosphate:H+ symporter n=1 Tax=Raoultella planticola TaxID=575 RepID=A0A485BU78_RAOPL|nr:phosphate:H+ symporter [Raoultella planticola]
MFETISASLGLNALFAFTGGLLGMHLAWKYPSRHVAIAGFALQFIALIVLALVGQPQATVGVVLAIAMLGLWLFAEGFGPGAQLMIYPALSYPTAIRATGVGFSRALSGIGSALALFVLPLLQASPRHSDVLGGVAGRHYSDFLPACGPPRADASRY